MLCREEQGNQVNSANSGIRKVNAALMVCDKEPPSSFPRVAPLSLKEHIIKNLHVLANEDLAKKKADSIAWTKDAADSQAQLIAHYYHVLSLSLLTCSGTDAYHCVVYLITKACAGVSLMITTLLHSFEFAAVQF